MAADQTMTTYVKTCGNTALSSNKNFIEYFILLFIKFDAQRILGKLYLLRAYMLVLQCYN